MVDWIQSWECSLQGYYLIATINRHNYHMPCSVEIIFPDAESFISMLLSMAVRRIFYVYLFLLHRQPFVLAMAFAFSFQASSVVGGCSLPVTVKNGARETCLQGKASGDAYQNFAPQTFVTLPYNIFDLSILFTCPCRLR